MLVKYFKQEKLNLPAKEKYLNFYPYTTKQLLGDNFPQGLLNFCKFYV